MSVQSVLCKKSPYFWLQIFSHLFCSQKINSPEKTQRGLIDIHKMHYRYTTEFHPSGPDSRVIRTTVLLYILDDRVTTVLQNPFHLLKSHLYFRIYLSQNKTKTTQICSVVLYTANVEESHKSV